MTQTILLVHIESIALYNELYHFFNLSIL